MAKILIKSYINKDRKVFADASSMLLDCTPQNVLSVINYAKGLSTRMYNRENA